MAAFITPPGPGEDSRDLWRKVAECADVLNALQHMTAVVEGGGVHMTGELSVSGDASVLKIQDKKEVSN